MLFRILLAVGIVVAPMADISEGQLFRRWRVQRSVSSDSGCYVDANGNMVCPTRSRTVTRTVTRPARTVQTYRHRVYGSYAAPSASYGSAGTSGGPIVSYGSSGSYGAPAAVYVSPVASEPAAPTSGSDAACCPDHERKINDLQDEVNDLRQQLRTLRSSQSSSAQSPPIAWSNSPSPPIAWAKPPESPTIAWQTGYNDTKIAMK